MLSAMLRDPVADKYLYDYPVSFVRLPIAGEYVILADGAYPVKTVWHTWDAEGNPYVVVDLLTGTSQSTTLHAGGAPRKA